MTAMKPMQRRLGHDHRLAQALWRTGWFEARILAALIDEPARVTAAQMDRWAGDFDNWAVCDTTCLRLFTATPFAWASVRRWRGSRDLFVKRAAFALLASLVRRDHESPDRRFAAALAWIERGASDPRPMVAKAVNWALRSVGHRSPALRSQARRVAKRLAAAEAPLTRWIGRNALADLA